MIQKIKKPSIDEIDKVSLSIESILKDTQAESHWHLSQIKADLKKQETCYYVTEQCGEIVAFAAVQDLAAECEIINIAVQAKKQGQGIGTALLEQIVRDYKDRPIFLEVRKRNEHAIALYRKQGFEEIGVRKNYYHSPKEDALIMRRNQE